MTIKKLKISFLIFTGLTMNAQTFEWSAKKTKITEESEYQTQTVLLGDKLFNVKTRYNDKVYNTDVYVDQYDLRGDFEKMERNLSVEQPAMGLNMSTFNSIFPLSGKEFVAFYTQYNKTTRENELFFETDDIETGSKTKQELAAKIPGKSGTNPGNFYVAQSADKKFYAIVAQPSYDKKINEKITLVLLDGNFKKVKELEYEFPFSSKQSGDQTIFVSDNGNVFLIKNIDLPKMKPYLSAYFWNTSANTVSEENLKLENDLQLNDTGRYRVTELESDRYKFKVPSLRNVEKTAPYMHDGRFGTLEAVLNHYSAGIQDSPTLDPVLKTGGTPGIPLSATEKTQLIAFLKTLTDYDYLSDSRFSEF